MRIRVAGLLLLFLGLTAAVAAAVYHLDPNGDDSAPGSPSAPWRTLDHANRILRAGDTLTLHPGTYHGVIRPERSGDGSTRPIIYRSEPLRAAILVGEPEATHIVQLTDRRHITLDGLKLLPHAGAFGKIAGCDDIVIRDCHMEGSTHLYLSLDVSDTRRSRFVGNHFTRGLTRTTGGLIHGDMVSFTDCSQLVIEGNDFSKSGHNPLSILAQAPGRAHGVVIRGNCFHNSWGRGFSFHNLERALVEGNILTESFNGATSADTASKVFLIDGIFRHNLVFENWDYPLASESYHTPPARNYPVWELRDSRIYHNTFADNPTYVWRLGSYRGGEPVRGNIFQNNLFSGNAYTGNADTIVTPLPGFADDNQFHHNLFFAEPPGRASVGLRQSRLPPGELNRLPFSRATGNLEADPRLVNPANRWFALAVGSPAIAAGRPLARAVGAGYGREVVVSDARAFFDGFGIAGERGDLVFVGRAKQSARIVRADLSSGTLTLDRAVRWVDGDPISLPYAGEAPDIGAIASGDAGELLVRVRATPAQVVPGQPVRFAAEVSGGVGAVSHAWDFGDETTARGPDATRAFAATGNYVIRLVATDATGASARGMAIVRCLPPHDPAAPLVLHQFEESDFEEWGYLWDRGPVRGADFYGAAPRDDGKGQCLTVRATASRHSRLSTSLKMRVWDLDRHPRVRFSYRIPPGTPVGVWVKPWPAAGRPERICLGGSPANSTSHHPRADGVSLLDDNRWHTVTIDARAARAAFPGLRLVQAFEFYTATTTREGQQFWFDDFAILP